MRSAIRTKLARTYPRSFAAVRAIAAGRYELMPPRRTYTFPHLHRRLRQLFPEFGGFFVEAGAFDGLEQSNTAYLEKYQGWRGILVEPIPQIYERCLGNRPKSTTVNAALVPFGYGMPDLEITYAGLMSVSSLTSLDAEAHAKSGEPHVRIAQHMAGMRVRCPAMTLDAIIQDAGYPSIDLLTLDVEGAEMSALAGLDFRKCRPRNMLIETGRVHEVAQKLGAVGYVMREQVTQHDFLFRDSTIMP